MQQATICDHRNATIDKRIIDSCINMILIQRNQKMCVWVRFCMCVFDLLRLSIKGKNIKLAEVGVVAYCACRCLIKNSKRLNCRHFQSSVGIQIVSMTFTASMLHLIKMWQGILKKRKKHKIKYDLVVHASFMHLTVNWCVNMFFCSTRLNVKLLDTLNIGHILIKG